MRLLIWEGASWAQDRQRCTLFEVAIDGSPSFIAAGNQGTGHAPSSQRVIVTINDRGPYGKAKRCIIDLSEAAARRLGAAERGMAQDQVVVVEDAAGGTRLSGSR
jgi:hypothetical protein